MERLHKLARTLQAMGYVDLAREVALASIEAKHTTRTANLTPKEVVNRLTDSAHRLNAARAEIQNDHSFIDSLVNNASAEVQGTYGNPLTKEVRSALLDLDFYTGQTAQLLNKLAAHVKKTNT